MQKVLIIYNPSSGSKDSTEFANKLNTILQQKNITTSLYETTGDDDFKQLIGDHMTTGFDTVAGLGGDGTASLIVNAVATFETRPNILLIPTGTTNNLARALGIDLNVDKFLTKIEQDQLQPKTIDIGKINYEYFISTASVGSIPEIAWKADDEHKEKFGSLGYVLDSFQVLNEEKTFDIELKVDGRERSFKDVDLMIIGLSNSVFGIQTFFEEAKIDDGYLYLYLLKQGDLLTKVGTLVKDVLPNHTDQSDEKSFTMKFKEAELNSNIPLSFAVDGDKGPQMPVKIQVLANHLTFYTSE